MGDKNSNINVKIVVFRQDKNCCRWFIVQFNAFFIHVFLTNDPNASVKLSISLLKAALINI